MGCLDGFDGFGKSFVLFENLAPCGTGVFFGLDFPFIRLFQLGQIGVKGAVVEVWEGGRGPGGGDGPIGRDLVFRGRHTTRLCMGGFELEC